jgi:tetraacyldisaccharide 4'-kinase
LCTVRGVSLSREAAHALETGRWNGLVSRALASAFAPIASRSLVRPAFVPPDLALVCVGGATLGGSGKTRVAVACARVLATLGARVVLVGHAYRAAPPRARTVSVDDPLDAVGDEAIVCARALAPLVPVVVGPTRQAAIDHAASLVPRPDVIVLDGPLRVRGRSRSNAHSLSVLAIDAGRPWGSGRLPPAGDLRAPRELLLAEADHVVPVDATPVEVRWPDGERGPLGSLRRTRLGLFTAIARPDRLVRALVAAGVRLEEVVSVADHGPLGSAGGKVARARARVDTWAATEKCALHFPADEARKLAVLEADTPLPPPLLQELARLSAERRHPVECVPRLHEAP